MINSRLWVAGLVLMAGLLSGCGGEQSTATGESAAPPKPIGERLAVADVERGQSMYFQCRSCHGLNEGGPAKVGPNLYGIFGSKAGSVAGFSYSDALANADVIWTPQTMDGWLAQPREFLPGNRMIFVGIKDANDRASLIAYLQQETG